MTKQGGLGAALYLDGFDLSGDVGAVDQIRGGCNTLDITGIDKSAMERIGGLRDGGISFKAFFNPTITVQEHARLSGLPRTDVLGMVALATPGGFALGDQAACILGKQVNYDPARGADGSLIFGVDLIANGYGVEWANLLTAGKRQDTTATNPTTGIDDLAGTPTSTAFGATLYVQVFSFTGTSITFTLRDSANNSTFAAVTGGASSAITAIGAARWATATGATIRRYLSIGTSGTFSECTFACAVIRHSVATI